MELSLYASLAQYLPERAANEPDRAAYIFLPADGAEQWVSYRQLYADALGYAAILEQVGVRPGELVLLVFEHGYEVIAAFWGAIHLGAVPAVFPYFGADPPPEMYQKQLQHWTDFADAKAILTLPELESSVCQWSAGAFATVVAKTSEKNTEESVRTSRADDDVAYIQLTTGSTGAAKGAMISHRGALSRMAAFSSAFGIHEGDHMVYWLPFNYSAGLQFPVIAPVVVGSTAVNLSPKLWTRHPELLLQAIHRFRGVGSIMPNSGLNHCVRNVRRAVLGDVDLSSWRVFGIAGEMLQQESLQSFAEQFAPYRFASTALKPFYACAECGLITAPQEAEGLSIDWISRVELDARQQAIPAAPQSPEARSLVSCGLPLPGVEISIVDEEDHSLPERHVGEIRVRSPRVLVGYYNRQDLTDRVLRNGWFHTGDLGYLAGGQLYLCDRKKDVIITGGRNLYAVDIESTAEGIVRDQGGRAVAFGLPDVDLGTELPILVAEVQPHLDRFQRARLTRQLRSHILREHGVALADVRLVEPDWIITTPKLSRAANRKKYLDVGFRPSVVQMQSLASDNANGAAVPAINTRADLEHFLTELFEGALGVRPVERTENFFDLGGDSLIFVNLLVTLENRLGRSLPIDELAEHPTIAGMVEALEHSTASPLPQVTAYNERLNPFPVIRQVLTDPKLPLATKGRRLRELVRVRLTDTGPRFLGYTLPYRFGAPLLEWLCAHTGVMPLLFRKRANIVRQVVKALGSPINEAEAVRQHLRTYIWMHWRLAALARCSPAEFDRWVTVSGWEIVQQALQAGRGVVIPLSHLGPYFFSTVLFKRLGLRNFMLVGAQLPYAAFLDFLELSQLKERHHFPVTNRDHRRASQLLSAQQLLRHGGIVLITGDGYQGKLPFFLPFCGRQRRFGVGFAELAARTGAKIIPIAYAVKPEGGIAVDFLDPLEAQGVVHQEEIVDSLVRQYVALLEHRWMSDPGSVSLYQLEWFLDPVLSTQPERALTQSPIGKENLIFSEDL